MLAKSLPINRNGSSQICGELPNNRNDAQPTGITFDDRDNSLIIADSNNGYIYRVLIDETNMPGTVTVLYDRSQRSPDGLTLDDDGRIIFTSYDNNEVVRLEADGTTTVLAKDFRSPSDVAFLEDRIYVTNFDALSLAPVMSILFDPSLPFTIDVIDLDVSTVPPSTSDE